MRTSAIHARACRATIEALAVARDVPPAALFFDLIRAVDALRTDVVRAVVLLSDVRPPGMATDMLTATIAAEAGIAEALHEAQQVRDGVRMGEFHRWQRQHANLSRCDECGDVQVDPDPLEPSCRATAIRGALRAVTDPEVRSAIERADAQPDDHTETTE